MLSSLCTLRIASRWFPSCGSGKGASQRLPTAVKHRNGRGLGTRLPDMDDIKVCHRNGVSMACWPATRDLSKVPRPSVTNRDFHQGHQYGHHCINNCQQSIEETWIDTHHKMDISHKVNTMHYLRHCLFLVAQQTGPAVPMGLQWAGLSKELPMHMCSQSENHGLKILIIHV